MWRDAPSRFMTHQLAIGYPQRSPWRWPFIGSPPQRQRANWVASDLNLTFEAGHFYALMGENGAGKSCLLKTLAGLLPARAGRLQVGALDSTEIAPHQRASWQGYLDQQARPYWDLSVAEVVRLGTLVRRDWSRSQAAQATANALHLYGCEAIANRPVLQLSTGEQQRVLLARVLAAQPRVILVDEPTAGLDPRHQQQVMQLLQQQAQQGALVVAVMHDIELARAHCDQAVLLAERQVYGAGECSRLLTDDTLQRVFGI